MKAKKILIAALIGWMVYLLLALALPAEAAPIHLPKYQTGGVITPTLPITPQDIDALTDQADAYAAQTRAALAQSQAAINSAYGALAAAQAGLNAAEETARQEHAARVSAEQGQIAHAVSASQAALTAANTAAAAARSANDDAVNSIIAANQARRDVDRLSAQLRHEQATSAGLTAANRTQQARIAQLETYSWDKYREALIAWVIVGVLAVVIVGALLAALIIFASDRRNRWPKLRGKIGGAIVYPIESNDAQR